MLLRACRVTDQQFAMLTQPTNGRLPNDEPTYRALFTALRRLGHVLEHHKDNIASGLHGKGGSKGHAYLGNEIPDKREDVVNTNAYPQWSLGDAPHDDDSWHQGSWSSSSWQEPPIATGWHPSDWTQTSTDQAFNTYETPDSGTDTDTVSSNDETWSDMDDIPPGLDDKEKAEELFWAYQRAKGRYRQFTRKPVRRVRRFLKRKGKGKGKGGRC